MLRPIPGSSQANTFFSAKERFTKLETYATVSFSFGKTRLTTAVRLPLALPLRRAAHNHLAPGVAILSQRLNGV